MKSGSTNRRRLAIALCIGVTTIALVSWKDRQVDPPGTRYQYTTDTIPQKKEANRTPRDLDEAIAELDNVDMKAQMDEAMISMKTALKAIDMVKIQEEVDKAMKGIDMAKIQEEVNNSLKQVDMAKINEEVAKALKEVDSDKMRTEIANSMAAINWDEMKVNLEKIKEMNLEKIDIDMKKIQDDLQKIEPEVRKSMEKAKVEIEKAKVEVKGYKELVDGLDNEGLINKKESYTIRHEDGKLLVNGKEASNAVYQKYRLFLDKHPSFTLKKNDDSFSIDKD